MERTRYTTGRRSRTRFRAFVLIVVLALVAAACTSGDTSDTTTTEAESPTTTAAPTGSDTTQTTQPEETTPDNEDAPVRGGVLQTFNRVSPSSWDPHGTRSIHTLVFAAQVFNQLVRVDPTQPAVDVLIPDLAESWQVSDDGLQYTFTLRDGVTWHDGTPFTADDVVYNLNRMTDPEQSSIADLFPTYVGAEATDGLTVVVTLSAPRSSFLQNLASGFAVMLPPHILEAGVDTNSREFIVGTGPFMIDEYAPDEVFGFVRNPDYFLEGQPYLDGVDLNILDPVSAQVTAFIAGQLDVMNPWLGITSYDDLLQVQDSVPEATTDVRYIPNIRTFFGRIGDGGPWDDPRVREAFALVIDMEEMVIAAQGDLSFGKPGGYLLPGNEFAWDQADVAQYLNVDGPPTDEEIAEAQALMVEAGYPDGFSATVQHRDIAFYTRMASVLGSQLQESLGVTLESAIYDIGEHLDRLRNGNFEFVLDGFNSTTGDPSEILPNYVTDSVSNYIGYSNPDYDALVEAQDAATDPAERAALIDQALDILYNDLPGLPVYWAAFGTAWYPQFHGYVPQPSLYTNMTLDYVWLDQ